MDLYSCTTNTKILLNSNYIHVHLHIPKNNLIAWFILPHPPKPLQILNPIPLHNIDKLNIQFLENNSTYIDILIWLLNNDAFTNIQWQNACYSLDSLIINITTLVQTTCSASPIPSLSLQTTTQGGYLPQKLQRKWKKHLFTYHTIRKALGEVTLLWSSKPRASKIRLTPSKKHLVLGQIIIKFFPCKELNKYLLHIKVW